MNALNRTALLLAALALPLAACANSDSTGGMDQLDPDPDPDPTPDPDPDPTPDPDATPLFGLWTGTAQVSAGDHLAGGTFPATVAIAQSGGSIRGVLDIQQDAGVLAESFAYLFEGTIDGDRIELEATDRMCGAGDPETLCNPVTPHQRVFRLSGRVDGDGIELDSVEILDSATYPPGVAIEPPFDLLQVTSDDTAYQDGDQPITATWSGPAYIPRSVVFLSPLPLHGDNTIELSGSTNAPVLAQFDNDLAGNVVPSFGDIVVPESFDYDATTGRFWFVQTATVDYRWLWTGVHRGNRLTGVVAFDFFDDPVLDPSGPPADPMQTDLLDTAMVFSFTAQ